MGTGMKIPRPKPKPTTTKPPYVPFKISTPSGVLAATKEGKERTQQIRDWAAGKTAAPVTDPFAGLADAIRGAVSASAGSDGAASALNAQLQREAQAEQTRQFNEQLALQKQQFAFQAKDTYTQRLLEAAGLATSPTGAIQLAYMARGQGAPQEQIRSIFQNLPFVQNLLQGKTLPGFGLPEQLGAATARVPGGNVTTGGTFGLTLPSSLGVTEQQFGGLQEEEKSFLGALHQAETGESSEQFFQKMLKGFIPTTGSSAALAF